MNQNRYNSLIIQTPEGISFALLLAGPVTRFMAWFIDGLVIIVINMIVQTLLAFLVILSPDFAIAISILGYFIISIGYSMAQEWYWQGQTIGKRLFKLRVMDSQGLQLQPSQIVIRNLLRAVDGLPLFYLLGGLACLISKKAQRLGDLAANTIVIRSPAIAEPDLKKLMSGKFNSLKLYPHLEARLRQRLSPEEAAVALQAILRRDELDPQARTALYQEIADYFKQLVPFPPEVMEGIPDEQYIRNVIDTVFQKKSHG